MAGVSVCEDPGVDDMLEDSQFSQLSDSLRDMPDIDSLLRPLSDSQRLREEELDMRDLRIREEGREEGEEGSGEQKVVGPQLLPAAAISRLPPGHPSLLLPPSLLYSSLRLDTDLGWEGRQRLLTAGLEPAIVDQMLEHSAQLVRRLAPETGQSRMIDSDREFSQVADFLFYSSCSCTSRLLQAILQKALVDLLTCSGRRWQLTASHLFTALLNLGFKPELLDSGEDSSPLPSFYTLRVTTEITREEVTEEERRDMLGDSLGLVARLLQLQNRHNLHTSLLSLLRVLVLLGLDPAVLAAPQVTRNITVLVRAVLDLCPLEDLDTTMQDAAEELLVKLPLQLGVNTLHPHNMLAVCRLMPSSAAGVRLRRVLSYLSVQLCLGLEQPDLPWEAELKDLWATLDSNRDKWRSVTKSQHGTTRCILALCDLIYSGQYSGQSPSSLHCLALRGLLGLLEEYRDRAGHRHDTLNLEPVIAAEVAAELANRWRTALNTAENVHKNRLKPRLEEEDSCLLEKQDSCLLEREDSCVLEREDSCLL